MSQKLKSITIDGQKFEVDGGGASTPKTWTIVEWTDFSEEENLTNVNFTSDKEYTFILEDPNTFLSITYIPFLENGKIYNVSGWNSDGTGTGSITFAYIESTKTFENVGTSGFSVVRVAYR